MTVAYLYKSGKMIPVEREHKEVLQLQFNVATIHQAIDEGFVRVRIHGNFVAFQARSRELICSAGRALLRTGVQGVTNVGIEFPGRYTEMTLEEFDEWL